MKACPFCAEEIQDAAVLCRFCGSNLREIPEPTINAVNLPEPPPVRDVKAPPAPSSLRRLKWVGVAFGVWILIALAVAPFRSDQRSADDGVEPVRAAASVTAVPPPPTPPPKPVPELLAVVRFEGLQFVIVNANDDDWFDVELDVNPGFFSGGYVHKVGGIPLKKGIKVGAGLFAKSDGTRLNPFQVKPQRMVITARLGNETRHSAYIAHFD